MTALVTANRLLDEMILSFGRMFTTGKQVKPSRRQTSGQPTANEIVSSSGTDAPPAATGSMEGEARSYPDPHSPGGGGTVIEADKFPRSSSSELQDNKAESNANRDDANDDSDDDEEKKWIKYWKNREPGQSSGVEGADAGYCEAVADTCG
ncbi:uncharacterized protein LOC134203468 [Armigeres subalbatus]|uniref:uncharacterized protein LOC134203468 n=1 Tax=Armigeres subalbatus TaxID=124917 RepID=UPI002ED43D10